MPNEFAAVVLGGGPAGAACALRLADRGISTLLVDKAVFPREKVCGGCLNLAAVHALGQMGLGQLPAQLGAVELYQWQARLGTTEVRCPLPGGFALSRYRLDAALIQQAAAAGATVRTGTVANIEAVTDEGVSIRLRSTPAGKQPPSLETVTASVAIVATGLSGGGVERWLPYRKRPSGPFGVGLNLRCEADEYPAGTIFMACGTDGYVGVVRIENGTLDVAAALMPTAARRQTTGSAAGESLSGRMMRIIKEADFAVPAEWEPSSASAMATPRLRRARRVGCRRLIAIGDAAGYIEPFTGEGMAWAMNSGLEAADAVAERVASHPELLGEHWLRTCQKLARQREWPCRLLTTALRWDWGRRGFFGSLHRMPWLAQPVIQYMNRAHVA